MFGLSPALVKSLAILAVLLAAFGAGWSVNGWRLNSHYQEEKREQLEANQKAFGALLADRDIKVAKITASNDENFKKLQESQRETNRLRNLADAGSIGLRIHAVCTNPGLNAQSSSNASMDTGTGAELAPIARRAYFDLRNGIDQATAQLAACQSELRIRQ